MSLEVSDDVPEQIVFMLDEESKLEKKFFVSPEKFLANLGFTDDRIQYFREILDDDENIQIGFRAIKGTDDSVEFIINYDGRINEHDRSEGRYGSEFRIKLSSTAFELLRLSLIDSNTPEVDDQNHLA